MPRKQSLLESLSFLMGCEYLSDLRFLPSGQRRQLAKELARLPVQEEDRCEWNDALQYLTEEPPQPTARAARDLLVRRLYTGQVPAPPRAQYPDEPHREGKAMERETKKSPRVRSGLLPVLAGAAACLILGFLLVCNLIIIIKGTLQPEKPPSVLGITPLVVLSGSMSGTIEAGDLVFVSRTAPEALETGDIIAYMSDGSVVTHRITAIGTGADGTRQFTTKGDANNAEDEAPVSEAQLVGVYRGRLPGVGDFALFLRSPLGMLLFIGVPVLAFILYDILRRQRCANRERERAREMQAELDRLRAMTGAKDAPDRPEEETRP